MEEDASQLHVLIVVRSRSKCQRQHPDPARPCWTKYTYETSSYCNFEITIRVRSRRCILIITVTRKLNRWQNPTCTGSVARGILPTVEFTGYGYYQNTPTRPHPYCNFQTQDIIRSWSRGLSVCRSVIDVWQQESAKDHDFVPTAYCVLRTKIKSSFIGAA